MRLTNQMRQNFADAVLKRVPIKHPASQDALVAKIESRLRALWPADLEKFVVKYPQQVYFRSFEVRWLTYRDDADHNNIRQWHCARPQVLAEYDDISKIEVDDLKELWEKHREELEERKALHAKIMQQAGAVTTTDALAKLFPDLVSLIPKDPPKASRQMPVADKGLIDNLVANGLELPL